LAVSGGVAEEDYVGGNADEGAVGLLDIVEDETDLPAAGELEEREDGEVV